MKFGDQLKRLSIPEWVSHNVDYQDIKRIIKERTTTDQVKPLSIPGTGDHVRELQDLESELFDRLHEEHERANLFVKIKYGEIEKKLNNLQKQIHRLVRQVHNPTKPLQPGRQQEKFSLLESRIFRIGEEIQDLQRFVVANYSAFRKLLKKYKKWTKPSDLESRFRREVLNRRDSYLAGDCSVLFEKYTQILSSCREEYEQRSEHKAPSSISEDSTGKGKRSDDNNQVVSDLAPDTSNPALLYTAAKDGQDLEFDCALATLPLGTEAGRAAYWVHQENLIGLRILLLEHMNRRAPKRNRSFISAATSRSSISSFHKAVLTEAVTSSGPIEDEVNLAVFDDLEGFARKQSAVTVGDAENATGTISENATISARWSSQRDAVIALVRTKKPTSNIHAPNKAIETARLKRKNLSALFDTTQPIPQSPVDSSTPERNDVETTAASETVRDVRNFIATHDRIKPLVQIQGKRSRFVGVKNQVDSGLWATLDNDVIIRRVDLRALGSSNATTPAESWDKSNIEALAFPHAVLELRWEGNYPTDLVRTLDQSHLVERVRGFSIETHAVFTLCRPQDMPMPFWIPVLDRDIRKIPPLSLSGSSRANGKQWPNQSIGPATATATSVTSYDHSVSGFSAPLQISSATSARDLFDSESSIPSPVMKKLPVKKQYGTLPNEPPRLHACYWNEFDDGDEAPEPDAYVIYVDPDAPSNFPGAETLSRLGATINSSARKMWSNVHSLIRPENKQDESSQPLLASRDSAAQVSPDSSDSEDVEAALGRHLSYLEQDRRRSALSSHNQFRILRTPEHERSLFRSYVGAFAASFVLLLITAFLPFTSRRKELGVTEVGVIVGVVASLCFGIVGLSCLMARRDDVGWRHRFAVLLAFGIDCVVSGVLLSLIGKV